jgi:iron complex transport system substrate-binding protein
MKTKRAAVSISILLILALLLSGCAGAVPTADAWRDRGLGNGWQPVSSMELQYAQNFSVDYYDGGYKLISISDGSRFLVVPENGDVPSEIDEDIVILKQPVDHIYLVATSAMCLFDALDSLPSIAMSGTDADGWYIENARKAMEDGDILYAGKYSKPDYELILANGCKLAIESTMINHAPDVKEKLEELGIPVLVEQSSYEKHPLGRTEWMKLYAALLGKEEKADRLFDEQVDYLNAVSGLESTGKTVAFFYISSSGSAVTRKSGDYVSKMIELAGGKYIFDNLGDPETATSTVTLEMEEFYATAKDADFIIYNSTIDGGVSSLEELVGKNKLLADFKAVKNGNVWCTGQNLYQETTQLGLMISNIHEMLVDDGSLTRLDFIFKLQ